MYINNLTTDLKCNVKLSADDKSLFTVAQEPNAATEDMNHDLELIHFISFHFIFNSLNRVKASITKITALQLALSTKQK